MTRPDPSEPAGRTKANGWRASVPELTIAAILVIATCTAVYLYAGLSASVLAVTGWALASLVLLRGLLPVTAQPLISQQSWRAHGQTSFTGFWRKRGVLTDAITRKISYDHELRTTLQHLLAARLAERHGVSLYAEPAAARELFLRGAGDQELWHWLDPQRPAETDQRIRGIPARTLAVVIDRLERL